MRKFGLPGKRHGVRRLVLDTNVVVSGLLNPAGSPGNLLEAVETRLVIPVLSEAILDEYRRVLPRPRFRLKKDEVFYLVDSFVSLGLLIDPAMDFEFSSKDVSDKPFYAAALAARCPLVTGNSRDYPESGPVEVLTPRDAVERLQESFRP